jgi:ethanolamine ammonia-lyase small subunit
MTRPSTPGPAASDPAAEALVTPAAWQGLKGFTQARIALGRAGHSQPTAEHLAFQAAHAAARDAVYLPLDATGLTQALEADAWPVRMLRSRAPDRLSYLQRPDWGRRLHPDDAGQLKAAVAQGALGESKASQGLGVDLVFVVADGLSARAINTHAVPFLRVMRTRLQADAVPWVLAPVCLVQQGRVAVGDEVGECLGARLVVVLIGERPGLSSPDSMGLYFTWAPRLGRTDAERNCISNVRPEGLPLDAAAAKLHHLLTQARQRELTGVALKDETEAPAAALGAVPRFLLP